MKKPIALILMFILLISCCFTAYAETKSSIGKNINGTEDSTGAKENKTKSNITFRGIPLGSSYTDTISALKEQGIELDYDDEFIDSEVCYEGACYSIDVAGHDMYLQVYFTYPGKLEDLALEYNEKSFVRYKIANPPKVEDCVFYYAQYSYTTPDHDKSNFDEIEIKLESLYGAPSEKNYSSSNYKPSDLKAKWEDDDAYIELSAMYTTTANYQSKGDQKIYIEYCDKKGDEIASRNWDWYRTEEEKIRNEKIVNTGTGGL